MKRKLKALAAAGYLVASASGAGGAATLTQAQAATYDSSLADAETQICKNQTTQDWIGAEFKKFGFDAKTENFKAETWKLSSLEFKAGGEVFPAGWVQGSPGTSTKLNGKILKNVQGDNPAKITAGILDAGAGTANEISALGGGEGKIWFVGMTESIPDAWALGLEAKAKKAAAVIVYDSQNRGHAWTIPATATESVAPIITVDSDTAQKIKAKLKAGAVSGSIELNVEYPVSESGQVTWVSQGDRGDRVFVEAKSNDCAAVGHFFAMLDWAKKSKLKISSTNWAVVSGTPESDPKFRDELGASTEILDLSTAEFPKFLSAWYKADRSPAEMENTKALLKKFSSAQEALKGVVDGETLRQYGEVLRHFERTPKNADAAEVFSEVAVRLKTLRQAYSLAQKGQWDQSSAMLKSLPDVRWAPNVSQSTYLEYQGRRFAVNPEALDPALWIELNKGKKNLDALLVVLEREIDRLDKRLADNFFKFQKSADDGKNVVQ